MAMGHWKGISFGQLQSNAEEVKEEKTICWQYN